MSVIVPVIVVGMVGTVVAVIGRQRSDTEFVFSLKLTSVTPAMLARIVASARIPPSQ